MNATSDRLIVCEGRCACGTVHTKQIHHRDFPELQAVGGTIREGADYLRYQLLRSRESATIGWHRTAVDAALADLDEFLRTLVEIEPDWSHRESCPCGQESSRRTPALATR
jgi:hypothetical protein